MSTTKAQAPESLRTSQIARGFFVAVADALLMAVLVLIFVLAITHANLEF